MGIGLSWVEYFYLFFGNLLSWAGYSHYGSFWGEGKECVVHVGDREYEFECVKIREKVYRALIIAILTIHMGNLNNF